MIGGGNRGKPLLSSKPGGPSNKAYGDGLDDD